MRIPAAFCGITCLKPTAGRLPLAGQGLDGGLEGAIGILNSLGFMTRSAKGLEKLMKLFLDSLDKLSNARPDARFVPIPWRESLAKQGQKLKIGWYSIFN